VQGYWAKSAFGGVLNVKHEFDFLFGNGKNIRAPREFSRS
jgi:hypothetical protein